LTFNAPRMHAALSSGMMATDLADYLVDKGIPFRDAHGVVGSLVRVSEAQQTELNLLPLKAFTTAHPAFGQDVFEWLSARGSVARRNVTGGTGPDAVRAQLDAARASLQ